ncbi:MAG TPA: hypothetical protein VMK65_01315 [Longimicrobiales bacterium]|nr:hypothetical protein [Longimicrobiales bacterium]
MRTSTGSRSIAAAATLLLGACGDGTAPPTVAAVQMTTTYANPRVGEVSHVTATPVNGGGVRVQGVACAFASSAPGIGAVDAGTGTVSALSPGQTVITATCADKSGFLPITVRPRLVSLTLTKTGSGSGSVFATPAGPDYDEGTTVSIQANPSPGSTFTGWGGDCAGAANPCVLSMDADRVVSADFANSATFVNAGPFGGSMTSVVDGGCSYAISASVTSLTLSVVTNPDGTITGTGSSSTNFQVTGNSASCVGNPFTIASSGLVSGTGASVNATLTHFSQTYQMNNETITLSGTRSGDTITGSLHIQEILRNGAGDPFTSTGTFPFTLTRQP